jgi:hypothetical protein
VSLAEPSKRRRMRGAVLEGEFVTRIQFLAGSVLTNACSTTLMNSHPPQPHSVAEVSSPIVSAFGVSGSSSAA